MEARLLQKSDRASLFAFINSESHLDRSAVDQFFHDVIENKKGIIVIEDEIIFALVIFEERLLNVCGFKVKAAHVIQSILRQDGDQMGLLKKCFDVLKSEYLITLNHLDEHFDVNNVFVNRQAYTIYRQHLPNVKGYYVSDDYEPQSLHSLYRYFMSKFSIAFDEKDQLDLEGLKQEHEIFVSQNEEGINGFIIYSYKKGVMHVKTLIYKDAKALLSLLNQAMGMNDKLIVEVSSFEHINKVIKQAVCEASDEVEIIVNNQKVFKRLFNHKSPNITHLINKNKLSYYFV